MKNFYFPILSLSKLGSKFCIITVNGCRLKIKMNYSKIFFSTPAFKRTLNPDQDKHKL